MQQPSDPRMHDVHMHMHMHLCDQAKYEDVLAKQDKLESELVFYKKR